MSVQQSVHRLIRANGGYLEAEVALSDRVVIFAHGSGSSRHSPRNTQVASALQESGIGTILIDLLTPSEIQQDRTSEQYRYDIGLLGDRVCAAINWAHVQMGARDHGAIGLYGASTGAAAALIAAARMPEHVGAIVSRGGRVDLAASVLPRVRAPLRMIVGDGDVAVRALNQAAERQLTCAYDLALVPGATHLFGEPGAMDAVVDLSVAWFTRHLRQERPEVNAPAASGMIMRRL